jgi:hypothetical protein
LELGWKSAVLNSPLAFTSRNHHEIIIALEALFGIAFSTSSWADPNTTSSSAIILPEKPVCAIIANPRSLGISIHIVSDLRRIVGWFIFTIRVSLNT